MTTYADAIYSALLTADRPISSRALYEQHDTFESPDQVSKAIGYLVKTGRAEVAGTEKPKNGKTIRLYRALTDADQREKAPSDLDQQLLAAIRDRDRDDAEALVSTDDSQSPLATKVPRPASHNRCAICATPLDDYDEVVDICTGCAEEMASAATNNRDDPRLESDDPVIRELARYREPRIQDGHRLARHLYAGAGVLQARMPGLATSMREAADALREFSA
ncbi:MAG: hypothetical protein GVY22_01800 [Gammaproteobacteria bacterium]|jgi:hypothetical protein|nr:hypothetical protein [Gammaproteobacteria bacterium]